MANQLKKITTRAKQIRKKRPGMQWKNAIKQAGAEYRSGKIGRAKKKSRTRSRNGGNDSSSGAGHTSTATKAYTARNRTATTTKTITAHIKVGRAKKRGKNRSVTNVLGSVTKATLASEMKRRIKDELALALLRRDVSLSRMNKRRYTEKINDLRRDLRNLE